MLQLLCSRITVALLLFSTFLVSRNAVSQTIDFDDLTSGQTLFGVDFDQDDQNDVVFSTTDPGGFGTFGPNPEAQMFIDGVVLEGASTIDADVRVDFPNGVEGAIQFGFVLGSIEASTDYFARVDLFDAAGVGLGNVVEFGAFPDGLTGDDGVFPEGLVDLQFNGVASYALLDFNAEFGRFVIDNFSGNFVGVPEPCSITWLLGVCGLAGTRRRDTRLAVIGE